MNRMDIIAGLLQSDKPLLGIEIGCLYGDFAAGILSKLPNLRLISIDPMPQYLMVYSKIIKPDSVIEERFNLIQATSDEAIRFLRRDYDFVFIDGDHSYEQTRKDILNYWQVVKKGGLLCGHNYDPPEFKEAMHPGVSQAVIEIFGEGKYNAGEDATWWKYV